MIENPSNFLNKLLNSLEKASTDIQIELIAVIPNFVVTFDGIEKLLLQRFLDLLGDPKLRNAVLEAISQLSPNEEQMEYFIEKLQDDLETIAFEKLSPVVEFLLQSVSSPEKCNTLLSQIFQTVNSHLNQCQTLVIKTQSSQKLKHGLISTPVSKPSKDSSEKYSKICSALITSIHNASRNNCEKKLIIDSILKFISSMKKELNLFDSLLLFSLIDQTRTFKKQVETLIFSKIKSFSLSELQVNSMFSTFHPFIFTNDKLINALINLARKMMKSNLQCYNKFAHNLYNNIFCRVKRLSVQKKIIQTLVNHISSTNENEIEHGLQVLSDFCSSSPAQVEKFSFFIKQLMDNLDNFSLKQITCFYRCFASISTQSDSFADYLDLKLRKQLASADYRIQCYGAIGSVTFISTFSLLPEEDSEHFIPMSQDHLDLENAGTSTLRSLTLDNTAIASLRESAFRLLEELKSKADQNEQLFGLFCDLLAEEVHFKRIIDLLVLKLTDEYMHHFETKYVCDIPANTNLEQSQVYFYCLDMSESEPVALNLKATRATYMISLFKLLWSAVKNARGDPEMSSLSALLGCSVTLNQKQIDMKDAQSNWQVLNWFRELLNAFAMVSDKSLLKKVFSRLESCVIIENNILSSLKTYKSSWEQLPKVIFEPEVKFKGRKTLADDAKEEAKKVFGIGKRGKSSKKSKKDEEESDKEEDMSKDEDELEGDGCSGFSPNLILNDKRLKYYCKFMRRFEWETFTLLKYHKADGVDERLSKSSIIYLLNELNWALSSIIPKSNFGKVTSKIICLPSEDLIYILKTIGTILLSLSKELDQFSEATTQLLIAINLCFQLLLNQDEAVIESAFEDVAEKSNSNQYTAIFRCLDHLQNMLKTFADISLFIQFKQTIITLVEPLIDLEARRDIEIELSNIAHLFLKKSWPNYEGRYLKLVLNVYLDYCKDTIKAVENITLCIVDKLLNDEQAEVLTQRTAPKANVEDSQLLNIEDDIPLTQLTNTQRKRKGAPSYPFVTKEFFGLLFDTLIKRLVNEMTNMPIPEKKTPADEKNKIFVSWFGLIHSLHVLMKMLTAFESNSNLKVCLKMGKLFIDAFLKKAMPLLSLMFKEYNCEVIKLLQNTQKCTRFLHHVCAHSKISREGRLVAFIPPLRRKMEELIYEVKALMIANNCKEAINFGTLRTKNIQGEEVHGYQASDISLSSVVNEGEEESSEESDMDNDKDSDSEDNAEDYEKDKDVEDDDNYKDNEESNSTEEEKENKEDSVVEGSEEEESDKEESSKSKNVSVRRSPRLTRSTRSLSSSMSTQEQGKSKQKNESNEDDDEIVTRLRPKRNRLSVVAQKRANTSQANCSVISDTESDHLNESIEQISKVDQVCF